MAQMDMVCSCGNKMKAVVSDHLYNQVLYWSQSYSCESCGAVVEADGWGPLPDPVRKAIIEQEGEWRLSLYQHKEFSKARYLIRKHFDYLIGPQCLGMFDSNIICLLKGTRNEMENVNEFLIERKLKSTKVESWDLEEEELEACVEIPYLFEMMKPLQRDMKIKVYLIWQQEIPRMKQIVLMKKNWSALHSCSNQMILQQTRQGNDWCLGTMEFWEAIGLSEEAKKAGLRIDMEYPA